MKKLMTILFSVLFVFSTQSVSAEDRSAGSGSGLQAIPVEFIAIPVIIILLIALGLLAKYYPLYRYNPSENINIDPALQQKSEATSPEIQAGHTDNMSTYGQAEGKETNKYNQAKVIGLPENEVNMIQAPAAQDDTPVPKEYKILHIMAYLLIISGLIMKFVIRRKKDK